MQATAVDLPGILIFHPPVGASLPRGRENGSTPHGPSESFSRVTPQFLLVPALGYNAAMARALVTDGSEPCVAVVGGGVIGVCSAYYLARRGARVVLLDRDEIGRGASFGNAGLISPGHPPINKPGISANHSG